MNPMNKDEQFYTMIFVDKGRMYPCKHPHLTLEDAHACEHAKAGVAIMEWVKGRNPQFEQVWTSPDIDEGGGQG